MKAIAAVVIVLFASSVFGDMYLHNPRGSNNRLNEANTNRNNANKMFDSQNNGKGGYCYGPAMSYYEGSLLSLEWTAQHGCGNPKLACNIVIQYMCQSTDAPATSYIRDGVNTDRIPDDANGPTAKTGEEYTYGLHESYESYQACKTRSRNMGLWISDREEEGGLTPGRRDSRFTRQNNDGTRYGYECPEERDYYPYWAPSQWKDIAILTNDDKHCNYYQRESQNVKGRGYCADPTDPNKVLQPNNKDECGVKQGTWIETKPLGGGKPDCIKAPYSRDNHLGNGPYQWATMYNWTLPSSDSEACIKDNKCNCVLRVRYNISTSDLGKDGNNPEKNFIDWRSNAANSPITEDPILTGSGMEHQLAIDTSQYGRTFEDRSYVFHIRPRKGIPSLARIYNLNVRGKRGNIVQAYPAVEYDFIPDDLYVRVNDYIHFQWTGCDTNPAGNAGEGTDKTDRSNIVQIENYGANVPASDEWFKKNKPLFENKDLRKRMAFLDQVGCKTYEQLLAENNNNEGQVEQDTENCMKLNAAPAYFDGGAIKMNISTPADKPFYYMSSRNNNFSNRGQKGAIHVENLLPPWAIGVVVTGAVLFVGAAGVAGATFYAKSHPHSQIAQTLNRF